MTLNEYQQKALETEVYLHRITKLFILRLV